VEGNLGWFRGWEAVSRFSLQNRWLGCLVSTREGELFPSYRRTVLCSRFSACALTREVCWASRRSVGSLQVAWRSPKPLSTSRGRAFSHLRRRDRTLGISGVLAGRAECRSRCGWFVLGGWRDSNRSLLFRLSVAVAVVRFFQHRLPLHDANHGELSWVAKPF